MVVTLAVGIGAKTKVFSFADSLWSRSHALPDLDRLVAISGTTTRLDSGAVPQPTGVAPADFRDWRTDAVSLEQLAAWSGWLPDLSGEGDTNLLGRTIQLTRESYTVVGILPDQQQYPPGPELWAPLTLGMAGTRLCSDRWTGVAARGAGQRSAGQTGLRRARSDRSTPPPGGARTGGPRPHSGGSRG